MKKNILALLLISMLGMNQGASAFKVAGNELEAICKGGTLALAGASSLLTALFLLGTARGIIGYDRFQKRVYKLEDVMFQKKLEEAYGATCSGAKKEAFVKILKKLKRQLNAYAFGVDLMLLLTGGSICVTALAWALVAATAAPKEAYSDIVAAFEGKHKVETDSVSTSDVFKFACYTAKRVLQNGTKDLVGKPDGFNFLSRCAYNHAMGYILSK